MAPWLVLSVFLVGFDVQAPSSGVYCLLSTALTIPTTQPDPHTHETRGRKWWRRATWSP